MNADLSLFPYVNLAAAVLTVVLGVWVVVRAEKAKSSAIDQKHEFDGPSNYVYLGGMFGQLTNKLDNIVREIKEGNEHALETTRRTDDRLDEMARSNWRTVSELESIKKILEEMDSRSLPRRR